MKDEIAKKEEEEIPANTWSFLKASRFWALVIGAASIYLKAKGLIGEPEMYLIATITGGFVAVRTVDRASEQKVVAGVKAVEAVQATKDEPPVQPASQDYGQR